MYFVCDVQHFISYRKYIAFVHNSEYFVLYQDNLFEQREISASNDSLSENSNPKVWSASQNFDLILNSV